MVVVVVFSVVLSALCCKGFSCLHICVIFRKLYIMFVLFIFSLFAMYSRTKKLKKRFFLDMEELFFSFSKKNLSICHSKSVYPWKSWMILQKTEVMLCVCLFVFSGKLDCLFCIFAWWIIVLTVLMRFLFSFFFSGRFFKLNGDLPAIYCDKNPQVVFILFFSARNFCFWSVMLRFDDFFLLPAQCTWKCFFLLLFRNFRKRKYSIQNRKWHIWLFFRWTAVQV